MCARRVDPELKDHGLQIGLNGTTLATDTWNGRDPYVVELSDLPAESFIRGENTLELLIPIRMNGERALIDVVMLNWIEIDYAHDGKAGSYQTSFVPAPGAETLRVTAGSQDDPQAYLAYRADGRRIELRTQDRQDGAWLLEIPHRETPDQDEPLFFLASPDRLASVSLITLDRPSSWLVPERQAGLPHDHPRVLDGRSGALGPAPP